MRYLVLALLFAGIVASNMPQAQARELTEEQLAKRQQFLELREGRRTANRELRMEAQQQRQDNYQETREGAIENKHEARTEVKEQNLKGEERHNVLSTARKENRQDFKVTRKDNIVLRKDARQQIQANTRETKEQIKQLKTQ